MCVCVCVCMYVCVCMCIYIYIYTHYRLPTTNARYTLVVDIELVQATTSASTATGIRAMT